MKGVARQVAAMQEGHVARVDAALERLEVIRFLPALRGHAMRCGQVHPLEIRERRLFFRWAHVDPDDAAELDAWVRLELDAAPYALARLRGQVHALAGHVVLPAMIGTAQAAFFVAAEPERYAAMGAELVDDADAPFAVAEGDQLLAEQLHAHRRAVALRQLPVEQRRDPVAPEKLAHRRAGTRAG